MKEYIVNSVSDYLKILEKIGVGQYVYRGQNNPYYGIIASGFRPYQGGWDTDKIYDIESIAKMFFDKVVSLLTIEEKKYFNVYCQHHGIPTNLVDFSFSPLVALFFSCDGKYEEKFAISELIGNYSIEKLKTDMGKQSILLHNLINRLEKDDISEYSQVYLINKNKLIDITELLLELNGKNLFSEINKSNRIRNKFGNIILSFFEGLDNNTAKSYVGNLFSVYEEIRNFYENNFGDDIIVSKREIDLELQNAECSQCGKMYLELLSKLIDYCTNYPGKYKLKLDIYFSYTPPNLFPRVSNQKGMFIYQPYIYVNDGVFDYYELIMQEIIPDIVIKIGDYKKVVSELKWLGIDAGFLYNDIDNVAKSVLNAYKF